MHIYVRKESFEGCAQSRRIVNEILLYSKKASKLYNYAIGIRDELENIKTEARASATIL